MRVAMRLKRRQADALRLEHERTGAPVSELIRRAIDLYLERVTLTQEGRGT